MVRGFRLAGRLFLITVYSKSSCVQCDLTKKLLDKHGLKYETRDVGIDDDALLTIKDMGYLQVPVVVTAMEHWSGFRPDKINALVQS